MRQVVLDTETTGIEIEAGHRIIEIGCIELINRKITGNKFHQYINPGREIDEGAQAVHGLTHEFLSDKPTFNQIMEPFIDFIKGSELIIHNAPFDVGFINHEFRLASRSLKLSDHCKVIDTLLLARQMHVGQRNSLDALCKRYNVDNSQRDLHGALLDSHLLAQVYLAMTGGQSSLFDNMGEANVTSAVKKEVVMESLLPRKLPIIYAEKTELESHEAKLQELLTSGKCVWLSS